MRAEKPDPQQLQWSWACPAWGPGQRTLGRHTGGVAEAGWGSVWESVPASCLGFPSGSDGKASAARRETWVRFLGRGSPLGRAWQPTPVLLPENPMDRSLAGCSPWGRRVGHGQVTDSYAFMPGGGVHAGAEDLQRLGKAQSPRFQTAACVPRRLRTFCVRSAAAAAPAFVPRTTRSVWPRGQGRLWPRLSEVTGSAQHRLGGLEFLLTVKENPFPRAKLQAAWRWGCSQGKVSLRVYPRWAGYP